MCEVILPLKNKRMKVEKFKVLLYLKKSGLDKFGKAPIMVEKPRDFDPFGQTGFGPFGYNMIAPLKSWCWGSILFYPFKISRLS